LLALLAPVLVAAPASAEVCDKAVGETWQPNDGPVWLLNPVGFPYALLFFLGLLVLLVITRFRWLRWLAYAVSSFLVLGAALLLFADLIPQHEIYLMQVQEGCRSYRTDLMGLVVSLALAACFIWLGHRSKQGAAKTQIDRGQG
jgi:hypothetical protein